MAEVQLAVVPNPHAPLPMFVLKIKPATRLYHAIKSLSNKDINEDGTGRIDVTEMGLEITVSNFVEVVDEDDPQLDLVGHLAIKNGMEDTDFQYFSGLEGVVDLRQMALHLSTMAGLGWVTISSDVGSNQLRISPGDSVEGDHFLVQQNVRGLPAFPAEVTPTLCDLHINGITMSSIIHQLRNMPSQHWVIGAYVTGKGTKIYVGLGERLREYHNDHKNIRVEERDFLEFVWPSVDVLDAAVAVSTTSILTLLAVPDNYVSWEFNSGFGKLVFLKRLDELVLNIQDVLT